MWKTGWRETESQVEIGKGEILTTRKESNGYLYGTNYSLSPHLFIYSFTSQQAGYSAGLGRQTGGDLSISSCNTEW